MDQLERRLRASLRPEPTPIPEAVDAAVLDDARRHRPRPVRVLRLLGGLAAAAAAGLLLWVGARTTATRDRRPDMVDAYRLALRIEAGADFDARWDRNADGLLDRRDVEALAREAVALDGEGRS